MDAGLRIETIDDWPPCAEDGQLLITEEPLGTKEKFWVTAPDGHQCLFKYARRNNDRTMGEDWVECAVHRLASVLSLPTATAVLATHEGRRGVLSRSVLSPGDSLIHGNELLARIDPNYDTNVARQNPQYTVAAIRNALADVEAPPECVPPVETAFDAFAGYLVLDAWVAGRDRHHENWAAINRGGILRLAPSFDHGNALGFQVHEDQLSAMAGDDDLLARWAQKGRSHHFAGRPTLTSVAADALELCNADVRAFWLDQLRAVSAADLDSVTSKVPAAYLSVSGRTFTTNLLVLNRERILNGG